MNVDKMIERVVQGESPESVLGSVRERNRSEYHPLTMANTAINYGYRSAGNITGGEHQLVHHNGNILRIHPSGSWRLLPKIATRGQSVSSSHEWGHAASDSGHKTLSRYLGQIHPHERLTRGGLNMSESNHPMHDVLTHHGYEHTFTQSSGTEYKKNRGAPNQHSIFLDNHGNFEHYDHANSNVVNHEVEPNHVGHVGNLPAYLHKIHYND